MRLDLPTFERPTMAISGMPVRGNCEGEAAERTKRASIRLIYSAMTLRVSLFVLGVAAAGAEQLQVYGWASGRSTTPTSPFATA